MAANPIDANKIAPSEVKTGRIEPAARPGTQPAPGTAAKPASAFKPGDSGEFNRLTSYGRRVGGGIAGRSVGNTAPISVIGLEPKSPSALVSQVLESEPPLGLLQESLNV